MSWWSWGLAWLLESSGSGYQRDTKAPGIQKASVEANGLKPIIALNPRHKKRRPWTSFFVDLVGRGNLNWKSIILIYKVINRFELFLEYLLEYRPLGCLNFHLHDVSEGAPTAVLQIELSSAAIVLPLGRDRLQIA